MLPLPLHILEYSSVKSEFIIFILDGFASCLSKKPSQFASFMVFAVTTWSLAVTNVKQLSNNAVYDQWSNHNHGRCLNSAK